ncbi:hypothetical protein OEZ85_007120 [Tetradesmus obliquus]|uniref:Uncharacterized protein n=1 Tax=Tetradesmus obliquus TaxID=3088 RepID=A0ABY8TZ69_TETOB|nr:hypothetical protein OEZ85_007120 [Tetradesmus obliquus]
MGKYAMWLGHWQPRFNAFTTQVEVVLHGSFDADESAVRGPNEAVRAGLKELEGYETAVAVKDAGWGPGAVAHEALTYAHAAAVVRGCSFPLSPSLSAKRLQQLLPFVGGFTARIIHQLLTTAASSWSVSEPTSQCATPKASCGPAQPAAQPALHL